MKNIRKFVINVVPAVIIAVSLMFVPSVLSAADKDKSLGKKPSVKETTIKKKPSVKKKVVKKAGAAAAGGVVVKKAKSGLKNGLGKD